MKYVRLETPLKTCCYGVVEGEKVRVIKGDIFSSDIPQLTDKQYTLQDVKLLSPVEPSKVLCIGLNYIDHAQEFGKPIPLEPLLFLKPPTSVIGPQAEINYPPQTANLHYEAELAIVIGKKAKNVKKEDASAYILGYTAANDVTARDLQQKDGQWSRAKGFDTFCPLGPWIETALKDPDNLDIKLTLNGETRQQSNTSMLVFKCAELVEYLSGIMTLLPGDVILTGTPGGIGAMEPGDRVEVHIEGIGSLVNTVVLAGQ